LPASRKQSEAQANSTQASGTMFVEQALRQFGVVSSILLSHGLDCGGKDLLLVDHFLREELRADLQ
jgi:hypothetical protein